MPRANRLHIPGQIWHITHRCHKREFLFKFARDRKRWVHWLFEARKRYGLVILDYMVTSNHVHLLVEDDDSDAISKSLQLVAGRTAQEFNNRKGRKGAYWEDRYHATAIESGEHLLRCLVYIDMNMVRAGVVSHPSQWVHSGYHEVQTPPLRYALINRRRLIELSGIADGDRMRAVHREWIDQAVADGNHVRDAEWSHAVAIGSAGFVGEMKEKLRHEAVGRRVMEVGDDHVLREPETAYRGDFASEMVTLSPDNTVHFDVNV